MEVYPPPSHHPTTPKMRLTLNQMTAYRGKCLLVYFVGPNHGAIFFKIICSYEFFFFLTFIENHKCYSASGRTR